MKRHFHLVLEQPWSRSSASVSFAFQIFKSLDKIDNMFDKSSRAQQLINKILIVVFVQMVKPVFRISWKAALS